MKTPNKLEILLPGETYHIYNRAVGNELLFKTEKDYYFFLKKLERFILPIAEIYCYCMLPNHFHFLLKIRCQKEEKPTNINRVFANFFISYSRSFNNTYCRSGRLFCQPFKRIEVKDEDYFLVLVNYIHRNPIHHKFVTNYNDWKYSSFNTYLTDLDTKINKKEVLEYFSSVNDFIDFHEENKTIEGTEKYLLE